MPTQKLMPMPIVKTLSPIKGSIAASTSQNGVTIVPSNSPLTRLNYFDGKFLRAADLQLEQLYLRTLVEYSNQVGGPGVANGFSAQLHSDTFVLKVGRGHARAQVLSSESDRRAHRQRSSQNQGAIASR
jgi:hypothetical protein